MMNSSVQKNMFADGVMEHPFGPIGGQPQPAQSGQPTLAQADTKLQFLETLKQKFGPDYMNRPEVQELLKILEGKNEQDLMGATAKADRTLAALLGR